jgi:hypothetical protein
VSINLKPGTRLFSAVCATEMIAVRAPGSDVALTIGGIEPVLDAAQRDASASPTEGHDGGTLMGKRYVDAANTIELLCTKPGAGAAAINGVVLSTKDAKPLPASD